MENDSNTVSLSFNGIEHGISSYFSRSYDNKYISIEDFVDFCRKAAYIFGFSPNIIDKYIPEDYS